MRKRVIYAVALLAAGLCWTGVCGAQSGGQQSDSGALPAAPTPAAAAAKDKGKAAAGENAAAGANAAQGAPDAAPDAAKKPSTAEDNPFPEDVSAKAAAAAKAAARQDAPSAAGASPAEKQAQGSSSLDNTDKLGLDDPARKRLKLESPDGTMDVYDPKRATEDVKVGRFYLQTGYYKGAYDRFKDATAFDHENVEAVFYLAEAARKLNLAKEAEQNYELYLAAVPEGPSAKAARKALGELGSAGRP
jgi:hypothetical protein